MIEQANAVTSASDATRKAEANSLLSPRFYRTDFAALERVDVEAVRPEWSQLMEEFKRDTNRDHFERRPGIQRRASRNCPMSSIRSSWIF